MDRPLCRVSPTWGTWEGGQQLSVCVTSLRLPPPPLLPLPLWLGPRAAWPPWPLRAGECAFPDCRRACFGALSGFPHSCGVLLLPLPSVARLLVGNTDRGLGYGYRHQLVSAGSWIARWRRGLTSLFCLVSHPSHVCGVPPPLPPSLPPCLPPPAFCPFPLALPLPLPLPLPFPLPLPPPWVTLVPAYGCVCACTAFLCVLGADGSCLRRTLLRRPSNSLAPRQAQVSNEARVPCDS